MMTATNFHKFQAYLINIIALKMNREISPVYLHPNLSPTNTVYILLLKWGQFLTGLKGTR